MSQTARGSGKPTAKRPPLPLPGTRVPQLRMKVWDAPTRLFHWAIVLLVAFSYVSSQLDWIQLHFLSGYTMLALLLFRLVWGLVGSETSRFSRFLKNPLEGLRHLAAFGRREPDAEIGHNAAGGWMVLVLLGVLAAQVGTGLFSNNDIGDQGPLAQFVSKATSDRVGGVHSLIFNVVLGVIGLHIVAVVAYLAVKRQNLVWPMITGFKRLPANMRQPRMASPALAALILAVSAGLVWALVRFT